MSYCRGIIYVVQSPSDNKLRCMSLLHNDSFVTNSREVMRAHLIEHCEDAEEINKSIYKACNRLREEIGNHGEKLEELK